MIKLVDGNFVRSANDHWHIDVLTDVGKGATKSPDVYRHEGSVVVPSEG